MTDLPTPPTFTQEHWQQEADCRGLSADLFFTDHGHNSAIAKDVCRSCPVRLECRDFAVRNNIEYGIFGGLSPKERRNLRPMSRAIRTPAAHGTNAAYTQHVIDGSEPCWECKEARTAYQRAYREASRLRMIAHRERKATVNNVVDYGHGQAS